MARARKSPTLTTGQLELFADAPAAPVVPALETAAPPEEQAIEFSPLDRHFARLMLRLNGGGAHPVLEHAAQSASAWRAGGHSCAPIPAADRAALLATSVVGEPGASRPLILDARNRLYLLRYWQYESGLAQSIAARIALPHRSEHVKLLEADLQRFFPSAQPDTQAGQREAVRMALGSSFGVIAGGPGTGKTRTVALVVALLAHQASASGLPPPRLFLAAPTGKAALRLTESIRGVLSSLGLEESVPVPKAVTLHRLLGLTPESATPRWSAAHPLPADAVIVDEASMIDLPLMAKLLAAVPLGARLLLLGDQDQLSSVETGHALGDIWSAGRTGPLQPHLRELTVNFRFPAESGIHRLSQAVRTGDVVQSLGLLRAGAADLQGVAIASPDALGGLLASRVVAGFGPALRAASASEALQALTGFRLLCALREGPFGVSNLNRLTEDALAKAGLIVPTTRHYEGRVIMVQRNDYGLRLYNGDIGVMRRDEQGELRAFFAGEDGQTRALAPSRLPEHETAWAMTVHKSQGSEFARVLLVLPSPDSPVVTRELIYTGITRAREGVEVWYHEGTWPGAVARQTVRMGGLRERLSAGVQE